MFGRAFKILVGSITAGLFTTHVWAFEKDTHYYLTLAIALKCSFSFQEAHLIASANWGQDLNSNTVAGAGVGEKQRAVNRDWHALDADAGRKSTRREELWSRIQRQIDREIQLVTLGSFSTSLRISMPMEASQKRSGI